MSNLNRPSLKGTKSNFALAVNYNTITDDRVRHFLHTEQNVRAWIEEALQIKLKGDTCQALKNGIVLCYLANTLIPDSIPKIQENTVVEFKLQENIIFFLAAMEELGVPKHKRFQLNDLWEGENVVKVVECLASLANISASRGASPIPVATMKPVDPKAPVTLPSGEALRNIKSLLAQIKEPQKQVKGARKGAVVLKTQMALMAGNQIDFAKCERGFIAFQTLWRGFKARKLVNKMKRDCAYRDKIKQEIYKTEVDYVNNLNICITEYMNPLIATNLLTKDQIKTIFSDITIIHAFGNKLIEKLRPRIESEHKVYQKLGDIFKEIADFLKVYTGYIQNYNNAIALIEELKKKEKFAQKLQECRDQPACKNFDITSFLITPIQRVPRYNLLLVDLVKHTWVDHPDYKTLCEATERIKSIANFLNEKKREGENFQKFTEIQSHLVGKVPQLFAPTRKYIKQGVFANTKKDDVVIYLFNDIIVYGRPSKGIIGGNTKVKYHGMIDLMHSIVDVPPSNPLQFTVKSPEHSLSLIAKNEEEHIDWVSELRRLAKELIDRDIQTKENKSIASGHDKKEAAHNQQQPAQSAEETLASRRNRLKSNADTTPPNTDNSLTSSTTTTTTTTTTTNTTTTAPTTLQPPSPTATSSNSPTSPSSKSFLSRLFGSGKTHHSSEPNTRTNSNDSINGADDPLNTSVDSTDTSLTSSTSTPNSPSGNRPKRPKSRKQSVDDIDIGTTEKTDLEDGGRGRSQSRLKRLTNTLRLTKKKDKAALDKAELEENEEKNKKEEATNNKEPTPPTITVDVVSSPPSPLSPTQNSVSNTSNNRNSGDSINLNVSISDQTSNGSRNSGEVPLKSRIAPVESTPKRNSTDTVVNTTSALTSSGSNSKRNSPVPPIKQQVVETTPPASPQLRHNPSSTISNESTNSSSGVDSSYSNTSNTTSTNTTTTTAAAASATPSKYLTIEEIKNNKGDLDAFKLESYLSPEEFNKVLGMDQEQFKKLPKWKQDQKKRERGLL